MTIGFLHGVFYPYRNYVVSYIFVRVKEVISILSLILSVYSVFNSSTANKKYFSSGKWNVGKLRQKDRPSENHYSVIVMIFDSTTRVALFAIF